MKGRINKLSKDIYDKIAAGEVVERPSSIVKELVENSIDAGAETISVEIKKGGKEYICVTDNGGGIHPDDINLVFERHATSKIRNKDDIYSVTSLGFRGEALSSISAVSEVKLSTKRAVDDVGIMVNVRGSEVIDTKKAGIPLGTRIEVWDLFYNTPARLKFLGSDVKEQIAITDLISKLALSHCEIAFKYIVDGKLSFITRGDGKLVNAIGSVYGVNIAKNLVEINESEEDIVISGYISKPQLTRSNRTMQLTFVNGRYVKCDAVSDTLRHGYSTYIPPTRFPMVFLNISINPFKVDVNIHPAKTEIKFTNQEEIMGILYRGVKTSLKSYNMAHMAENMARVTVVENESKHRESDHRSEEIVNGEDKPVAVNERESNVKRDNYPIYNRQRGIYNSSIVGAEGVRSSFEENNTKMLSQMVDDILSATGKNSSALQEERQTILLREEETAYDGMEYIGSFNNTFLIFQKSSNLYLIDQHAAHEKIIYEKLIEQITNHKVEAQILLLPIRIDLTENEIHQVKEHSQKLKSWGIGMEFEDDGVAFVREIPLLLGDTNDVLAIKDMIMQFIGESHWFSNNDMGKPIIGKVISKACKSAIKANMKISYSEAIGLIEDLKKLDEPYSCPHGRPIMVEISDKTIRNMFYRT